MSVEIVERGGRVMVSVPYSRDWCTWAMEFSDEEIARIIGSLT